MTLLIVYQRKNQKSIKPAQKTLLVCILFMMIPNEFYAKDIKSRISITNISTLDNFNSHTKYCDLVKN